MAGVFDKPEKFHWRCIAGHLEDAPLFPAPIALESESRKDFGIELLCPRPIAHAQVDVIKNTRFHSIKFGPVLTRPLLGSALGPLPRFAEESDEVAIGLKFSSCKPQGARRTIEKTGNIRIERAL